MNTVVKEYKRREKEMIHAKITKLMAYSSSELHNFSVFGTKSEKRY